MKIIKFMPHIFIILIITYFSLYSITEKYKKGKYQKKEKIKLIRYLEDNITRGFSNEGIEYYLNNHNLSIYNNNQLEKDFFNLSNYWPFNVTEETYSLLLQNQNFLLKLLNKQYSAKEFINKTTFYPSDKSYKVSLSDAGEKIDAYFYFYKAKNLTSNEDVLIFEEINQSSGHKMINFANINDLVIDVDKENNLFRTEIFPSILININEGENESKISNTKIEILFQLEYFQLNVIKNNNNYTINIPSINTNNSFDIIKKSLYLESVELREKHYKHHCRNHFFTIFNLFNIIESNGNIFNCLLIIFSLINIFYVKRIINSLNNNKILIFLFSGELFFINLYIHFFYFLFSFFITTNILGTKTSWIYYLINGSGSICSFINIFKFDLKLLNIIIKRLNKEISCLQKIIHFLILIIVFVLVIFGIVEILFFLILEIIMWSFQIINNIIHNNKYIYPVFYIFFFTIDKFMFNYFINLYDINFFIIIIIQIIILYLQAFLGPRFMCCCKCQDDSIYKSKNELLNEKPNSRSDNCMICLSPLFNTKNYQIKEIKEKYNIDCDYKGDGSITIKIENINTSKSEEKLNNNKIHKENSINRKTTSKKNIYSYNCFNRRNIIKNIITKGFLYFYILNSKCSKNYMLLPCGHYFHSICLDYWIQTKKICPICRRTIISH